MENLLQSLADAGIRTDSEQIPDITADCSYRGNFGFYHIYNDKWEIVFVKGVYKGHVRRIRGECSIEERKLNEMAQILSDAERCLRHPAFIRLTFDGEHSIICSAEKRSQPFLQRDCRDRHIPDPLTPVEASLGKHNAINDKHLFAKSPFSGVFGETLSPFAFSIAEKMPDILSPLFMGATVKTYSPSIKPLYGRLYMNISNTDVITKAFNVTSDCFYLNFLPSVFKTLKKPSLDVPNLSVLQIKDEEITASINDIENSAKSLTKEDMLNDSFFELIALGVMTWEMAYLNMWKSFSEVLKITKDVPTAMRHVYKTRKGGLLTSPVTVMPFFDPAYAPVTINPMDNEPLDFDIPYKELPTAKRLMSSKTKYTDKISEAHRNLDIMDKTYVVISSLVMKTRELLLTIGLELKDKNILTDENDIFYLEYNEVKNLINDEFFGNIPFTLNFRKWQNHRNGALCLPAYLYEKDIENISAIASKQMEKSEAEHGIPCISYFHKELKTENFVCGISFNITEISGLDRYDVVIAESASVFSYLAQFCTIKDKPLYTGARFARILTEGKIIETSNDSIKI